AAGARVTVGQGANLKAGRSWATSMRRIPGSPVELRVPPGLYRRLLTEEAGHNFFSGEWKVAPEADRMGVRFRGGRPMTFKPREQPFGAGSDPSNIVDGRSGERRVG